jgi:hypothetical protein
MRADVPQAEACCAGGFGVTACRMIEQPGPKNTRDNRAERLAKALRENLKRRKTQAKSRRSKESDAIPVAKAELSEKNSKEP